MNPSHEVCIAESQVQSQSHGPIRFSSKYWPYQNHPKPWSRPTTDTSHDAFLGNVTHYGHLYELLVRVFLAVLLLEIPGSHRPQGAGGGDTAPESKQAPSCPHQQRTTRFQLRAARCRGNCCPLSSSACLEPRGRLVKSSKAAPALQQVPHGLGNAPAVLRSKASMMVSSAAEGTASWSSSVGTAHEAGQGQVPPFLPSPSLLSHSRTCWGGKSTRPTAAQKGHLQDDQALGPKARQRL